MNQSVMLSSYSHYYSVSVHQGGLSKTSQNRRNGPARLIAVFRLTHAF